MVAGLPDRWAFRYGFPRIEEGSISRLAAELTLLLVWFHLLAAVSWIGGTIFLSVVLVLLLRREAFAS